MSDRPTREQIVAEPAGPRLDAWCAEFAAGLRLYRFDDNRVMVDQNDRSDCDRDVPHYSTDIAAAWPVAEKLDLFGALGYMVVCDTKAGTWHVVECEEERYEPCSWNNIAEGDTAPHAIARAALLVTLPPE